MYISTQLITLDETKHLNEVFRQIDTNGDGLLDRGELIAGYAKLKQIEGQEKYSKKEIEDMVDEILAKIDLDGNGEIDFNEFVSVAVNQDTLLTRERLKAAFDVFDADGGGTIDKVSKCYYSSIAHETLT